MSKFVSTELGRFRQVVDGQGKTSFLFECPACGEWLPLSEEHLSGSRTVEHLKLGETERLCEYQGPRPFGATLISTMQARILMGESPEDAG